MEPLRNSKGQRLATKNDVILMGVFLATAPIVALAIVSLLVRYL